MVNVDQVNTDVSGATADVSRSDPLGDIMLTSAWCVVQPEAAMCHLYLFFLFNNHLLIPKIVNLEN